ncbi:tripartite tricarboxylate transporter substrate binding protein [Hydrogenophaga sp.]|uniref:Bug family tripartite tricarboxylate transporter substrate binding protein n=1 Tax=Hydrogenophaga sp. TaxID=1904254 RepID=UPI0027240F3B|nr:tripartite tricarboxylate transporter substrate binding protein [Hydrogenophaga sp.]MDO9436292.1 tripartite tricarboxylate transporter substrate binding protein [Hydrogenophaga sp.]
MIFKPMLATLALGVLTATGVAAQGNWPTRPVKLLVHAPAGGAADVYARLVADGLQAKWGQPVVVDNKAGANGLVATQALMGAAPDGYTLMQTATGPVAMNPIMHGKAYDPAVAYAAIGPVTSTGMIIVAGANEPYTDLRSLAAYAKANPGKLSYATAGAGAVPHIGMEYVNVSIGAGMLHVPFRGEAQFIPELLSGRVSMAMMIAGSALPHVQSGKLKAIAVTSAERNPLLPNVKTLQEEGIKVSLPLWFGLVAPAGTPNDILKKVNADLAAVTASAPVQKRFAELSVGVPPVTSTDGYRKYLIDETQKWATMIKETNISVKAD